MVQSNFDILGFTAVIILCFPIAAYVAILRVSYKNLLTSTQRIQVLSTRTAIFLPVYSIIIWISLVVPVLYVPLQIPTALAEGYCFYCFFAMVVQNLGGPNETIAVMEESGKKPLLPCCCPSIPLAFFMRVQRALFHFLWTRTLIVLVSVICTFVSKHSQSYHDPAFLASLILTVTSFALLINGFGSLVLFYEVVMLQSTNLLGTYKIVLLKISVGLIVIQGLIEEFLYAFGVIAIQPSGSFSGQDRAQRFYCFVVLIEYALLSAAVYYAYAAEIKPNERSPSRGSKASRSASTEGVVGIISPNPAAAEPSLGQGQGQSQSQSQSQRSVRPTISSELSSAFTQSQSQVSASQLSGMSDVSHMSQLSTLSRLDGPVQSFYDYLHLVFSFSDVFYGMAVDEGGTGLASPLIDANAEASDA